MATVKALKDLHGTDSFIKAGDTAEMEDTKAEFHAKRGNVEILQKSEVVKTKELKVEVKND